MQLEGAAGFKRQDTPEAKLDKLASLLASSSGQEIDTQLLAELLSVPTGTSPPLLFQGGLRLD